MKFSKTHERQLREFIGKMDESGAVPVNEWTSGKGRFTTNKALPPFVTRFERKEYGKQLPKHDTPERVAYDWLQRNPRRKAVLILDMEALAGFAFEAMHGREL